MLAPEDEDEVEPDDDPPEEDEDEVEPDDDPPEEEEPSSSSVPEHAATKSIVEVAQNKGMVARSARMGIVR